MIDLHTHTTASDGRLPPAELVALASAAGLRVLGLTDHDTMAACAEAASACAAAGIEFVPGIEVTAVRDGVDVHLLGYFLDPASPVLTALLREQRARRLDRIRTIVARLAAQGIALDADAILRPALDDGAKAAGRPWVARALVAGGYAASTAEAFDRWLAEGRPAFVPRVGPSPQEVIERVHEAGGIVSLAHPGLLRRDGWIAEMAGAGLDAIEAYHSDHDPPLTAKYLALAAELRLAVSGGSDYHGDGRERRALGATPLPPGCYDELKARWRLRAARRATASGADTSS